MIRSLIAIVAVFLAGAALAQSPAPAQVFHVGDTATYAYIGSDGEPSSNVMVYTVTSIADEGVWLSLGYSLMTGPQNYKLLIDPATKRLKRVIYRGYQQPFSDPNAAPATQGPDAKVSVPAGEFPCSDRKVQWPNGNTDDYWIDSSGAVPIFGYVRIVYQVKDSAEIRLDLVSYERGS